MKPSLALYLVGLVAGLCTQPTFAQKSAFDHSQSKFAAGSWQFGVKGGYGKGNLVRDRSGLHLHSGYYVANKLMVGLGAAWSREWTEQVSVNDLSAGPFARYQFTTTRCSPFVEASYQFGQRSSTYPGSVDTTIQAGYISPGLSIRLFNQLRADISYSIQFSPRSSYTESFGQAQIGFTYLVGKHY